MRFIVIFNAKAGTAAREAGTALDVEVREAFAQAGVEADVQAVEPEKIEEALRAAMVARPEAIIIGGGDGTVRSAAALLAGSDIPLGVLPLGTLNHFAKDLKIPPAWREAVPALSDADVREVDLGEVNGHVFINNCSLGAYADSVRRRDALREERPQGKGWAMFKASFATFRKLRRLRLRITVAGRQAQAVRTPVVVIANNRYSGHVLNKNMRARINEGHLWIYTAHVHRHLPALRMAWQCLTRKLDAADALASEPATELTIENEAGSLPVAADGELVELKSPLHFKIRPRALRVLVPREKQESAKK